MKLPPITRVDQAVATGRILTTEAVLIAATLEPALRRILDAIDTGHPATASGANPGSRSGASESSVVERKALQGPQTPDKAAAHLAELYGGLTEAAHLLARLGTICGNWFDGTLTLEQLAKTRRDHGKWCTNKAHELRLDPRLAAANSVYCKLCRDTFRLTGAVPDAPMLIKGEKNWTEDDYARLRRSAPKRKRKGTTGEVAA